MATTSVSLKLTPDEHRLLKRCVTHHGDVLKEAIEHAPAGTTKDQMRRDLTSIRNLERAL